MCHWVLGFSNVTWYTSSEVRKRQCALSIVVEFVVWNDIHFALIVKNFYYNIKWLYQLCIHVGELRLQASKELWTHSLRT